MAISASTFYANHSSASKSASTPRTPSSSSRVSKLSSRINKTPKLQSKDAQEYLRKNAKPLAKLSLYRKSEENARNIRKSGLFSPKSKVIRPPLEFENSSQENPIIPSDYIVSNTSSSDSAIHSDNENLNSVTPLKNKISISNNHSKPTSANRIFTNRRSTSSATKHGFNIPRNDDTDDIFAGFLTFDSDKNANRETPKRPGIPRSLPNEFGSNFCYVNSAIQSLFSFTFFMEALQKCYRSFEENISKCGKVTGEMLKKSLKAKLPNLSRLVNLYEKYMNSCLSSEVNDCLRDYKRYFGETYDKRFGTQFRKFVQQDAGEFFSIILQIVNEEINHNRQALNAGDVSNPVDQFHYILALRDVCPRCRQFNDLASDNSNMFHLALSSDRTLQSAFIKRIICDVSSSMCPNCNISRRLVKSFEKLPKVLVFQTARYNEPNVKDSRQIHASHDIFLPRKYIKEPNMLLSPLSTPYKTSLKRSCANMEVVKKLNFEDQPGEFKENGPKIGVKETVKRGRVESKSSTNQSENLSSIFRNEDNLMMAEAFSEDYDPNAVAEKEAASINVGECERYQLASIICHHGSSTNIGHYVSYIFSFEHSAWYLCDDSLIEKIEVDKLLDATSTTSLCYYYVHTRD